MHKIYNILKKLLIRKPKKASWFVRKDSNSPWNIG